MRRPEPDPTGRFRAWGTRTQISRVKQYTQAQDIPHADTAKVAPGQEYCFDWMEMIAGMEARTPTDRIVLAAQGYYELEMMENALAELDP